MNDVFTAWTGAIGIDFFYLIWGFTVILFSGYSVVGYFFEE